MKIDYRWDLFDQIAVSILILDHHGTIQYLNDDACDLLEIHDAEGVIGQDVFQYFSEGDRYAFNEMLSVISNGGQVEDHNVLLCTQEGSNYSITLTGRPLEVSISTSEYSIWTLNLVKSRNTKLNQPDKQNEIENFQWLADQGRILLSLDDWSEILDRASLALQEKLGDCFVISLMMVDDFNVRLEGVYGIENQLLNQSWKILGKDFLKRTFPIDERLWETYSKRRLFKFPGEFEDFASSQVPGKVSKKLSEMVGLKDIYTIGLEGKQEVLGCFYILTINDRQPINAELVETFTFQVALALEKSKYAREMQISENKFQTIFEFAPDGYYICDFQGKFLNWNLAAEKITGYTREELIGKSFLDAGLLSKSQIPIAGLLYLEGITGKSTGPSEFSLIRKDGSVVEVEISSYPVTMGDEAVILGIARDISYRKQSEEDLHIAHESLKCVLEGIDAHVYVADFETYEILYMNKRMIEDYGGNFVGKLCHEIFRNSSNPCTDCSNPKLINNFGEPSDVYVWEGQNEKTQYWYRNYDRAIRWTDQRLVRLQIAVDITESKKAASTIMQSEERYRSLFETSHNAIMTLSPPDWRFTSGNSAMLETFGLEDETQFLSLQPWQLSPEFQPDGQLSAKKAREMIEIAVEKGSNFFPWTHKRFDGEEFSATVQLKRVDLGDKFFLQATVRDVTVDILANKVLRQKMDDLELINQLSNAANNDNDVNDILDLFSLETTRIIDSSHTSVFVVSDDGMELTLSTEMLNPVTLSQFEKIPGLNNQDQISINLDKMALFRECLESGEAFVISQLVDIQQVLGDMAAATPFPEIVRNALKNMTREIITRLEINSLMLLPLVSGDKKIGLVFIHSTQHLDNDDLQRLTTITDQLSAVMYRVEVDREKREKSQETEFIYSTLVRGSRIDDIDELCDHLAKSIRTINPNVYVLVSLFDPELDAIRVRSVQGLGKFGDRIFKLMGVKPEDFSVNTSQFYLDDDLNKLYTSGKLEVVPGGIFDLTRGTISKRLCKSLEKLTGVSKVFINGFSQNDKSTGGLILFLKEGQEIRFPEAIETVISQYSVILDRRMSQQEVVKRKSQLEALREIELEIASDLDIESLLKSISEKAKAIVNAAACGFSIYNPDRDILEYTAYTGFDELPEDTDVSPGEGLSGNVWENKETLIVQNYKDWEGRLEKWTDVSNYYLAGIPVSRGDEMLGVLEVALDPSDALTKNEIATLELFATQAAIALNNARLFRNEKLKRIEADTLREVGVLINRLIGQPELLDMILTSLNKVVSYSSASIQLVRDSEIVIEAFLGEKSNQEIIGTTFNIQENDIARRVLIDGENIILDNEDDVHELLAGPIYDKVESWLAVPLESKGHRIGILTLDHALPGQFTKRDAALVKDFAAQAVVALENNRLFGEIRRRTKEIEAVYDSALSLTKELQPDILFDGLYQQIDSLFSPDAFILAIYDQNSDMINVAYATETGRRQPQAEELSISPEQKNSILGWIIRNKSPLLIGNVETDSIPLQPVQKGRIVRSLLGVPILIGDRITGALVVQSYQPNKYTRDDQRLIQLLGNQVAIALENSRLFDDAQRRLARLSSLREIDQAISGGTNLELTMDVLVNQLIHTLGVDAACVLAYVPAEQRLEYVDAKGFRTNSLQYTSLKLGAGLAGKAALEKNLVFIPDLMNQSTSLQQSPTFAQEEFVTYLAHPLITKGGLVGVLEIFHRAQLNPDPEWFTFLDSISRLAAIAIDRLNLYDNLARSNIELKQAYDATIEGWAKAIELRDGDTEGHSRRVVALTMNLARKMGVSDEELVHMRRGALLHDIGKMAIPDGILLKSGKLSHEEWLVMKKHPSYAHDMLSKIDYLQQALDIPVSHHERWDGSGYPQGLEGKNIPLQARIFAVVDVWDALQSDRPYRDAWTEDKTIQYLKDQSGKEFDPRVVKEFLELIGQS